ncbi:MAG: HAMP domain-containing histidine kinase [Nitrosospira sp.]|nr:HAMP domain-containing histidine kinase [Nitrosospira sp.]MDN5935237.1 HAMP domain-containing histidine kinase [Nitrosospira sp.]
MTLDLLAYHSFPRLAAALRSRSPMIIEEWEAAVLRTLPAADELTLQQLGNSLPLILQQIIDAFASDKPFTTRELMEGSKMHGEARFHENYNVPELIVEYRLLRRVIIEQVSQALDERLDVQSNVALNMAVDTALQSGMVTFTEQLQRELRASAEAQAKYLSYLSHDLRNHLNHATLHLQLLAARLAQLPGYEDSVEDIHSIKHAIFQTTVGMDRLLDAERLRKSSVALETHPVNLNLLMSDISKQMSHEVKSKGLELIVDVPEGAQAASDEALLTLVLQNLLGNAVKYSSTGRIKMMARNTSNDESIGWVLSISDEGPGIAPESLNHLFLAFRRGDTYGTPGVGLGLSIASQAAGLLGGKLEIESEVNAGSTFRLVLPGSKPAACRT